MQTRRLRGGVNAIADSATFWAMVTFSHIEIEPGGFPEQWVDAMKAKGHTVEVGRRKWGNMQAVFLDKKTGRIETASDPSGQSGVLF